MKRTALDECSKQIDAVARRVDAYLQKKNIIFGEGRSLQRELIRLAHGPKATEAQEAATQRHYETQTNTPVGYDWINGRLTKVGPDK